MSTNKWDREFDEAYDRAFKAALARKQAEQFMASESFKKWLHGVLSKSVNKAVRTFYGMPPEQDYSAQYEAIAKILMEGVQKQVGTQPRELYRSITEARAEDLDPAKRILWAIASREEEDAERDIIRVGVGPDDGIKLRRWFEPAANRNGTILWAHQYAQVPIGRTLEYRKTKRNGIPELQIRVQFAQPGTIPVADIVWSAIKQQILTGWSIGFVSKDYTDRGNGGRLYHSVEIVEISAVPLPSNSGAVTIAFEKGTLPPSARQIIVEAFEHLYSEGLFNGKLVPPEVTTKVLAHLEARGA